MEKRVLGVYLTLCAGMLILIHGNALGKFGDWGSKSGSGSQSSAILEVTNGTKDPVTIACVSTKNSGKDLYVSDSQKKWRSQFVYVIPSGVTWSKQARDTSDSLWVSSSMDNLVRAIEAGTIKGLSSITPYKLGSKKKVIIGGQANSFNFTATESEFKKKNPGKSIMQNDQEAIGFDIFEGAQGNW